MKNSIVIITGANGNVAQHLGSTMEDKGYKVRFLTRKKKNPNEFEWNIDAQTIDESVFENLDHIIHLAGCGIAEKKWTPARKKEIISSRVDSAKLILNSLLQRGQKIKSFISSSGISAYGTVTSDKIFEEKDDFGSDFLADVVKKWENIADEFESKNIADKVVKLRTAVVLSDSGAIKKMIDPIKNYIGSPLGNGNQWMPWIHIDDLVNMYIFCIENNIQGSFNASASEHVTNKQVTMKIAEKLNRPILFPNVPSFIIKFIFGEISDMILKGSRVSNQKILNCGFQFRFSEIDSALEKLLK